MGTYTRGKSKGIYAWRFNPATGKLNSLGLAAETSNPSFLAVHPNRRFLYAVNENNNGMVSAFSIDAATAKLTFLNSASSRGSAPATWPWTTPASSSSLRTMAAAVSPCCRFTTMDLWANPTAFVQHDGSSVNKQRQSGPHAHCVTQSPDGRFLLVEDLGLDEVLVYRFDASKGTLTPNDPPFGKVPAGHRAAPSRLLRQRPLCIRGGEMLSTVNAFRYDAAHGSLDQFQTISMLPADFQGKAAAPKSSVHPNGKVSIWLESRPR